MSVFVKLDLLELSRAVNNARKNGQGVMARAILRARTHVRQRQHIERNEHNRKKNDCRFMVDRYGCLKRLFSEESLEPQFSKEEATRYLNETFKPHQLLPEPVPDTMPKGPGMEEQEPITSEEILLTIKGKRDASAPGTDGIRYGMLRNCGPKALERLASFFTKILNGDLDIPPAWGIIRVKMIHKGKGADPILIDSFRPISLTSIIAKIFNSIIKKRIEAYCLEQGIIDGSVQKGFMPKVSGCEDHINAMSVLLRSLHKNKKTAHILLADLKAAYNCVPHDRLWQLLEHIGIAPKIVTYLQQLYKMSRMYVHTNDFETTQVPVGRGVLQGDTLSPLLFTIFFMVVIRHMQNGTDLSLKIGGMYHFLKAFADDLTIITPTGEKMGDAWKRMQEALKWCGLSENAKKCRYLVFDKKAFIPQVGGVTIDNKHIPCGIEEKSVFLGCDLPLSIDAQRITTFLKSQLTKLLDTITAANFGLPAKLFFYETKVIGMMRWWFTIYKNITLATVRELQGMAWAAMARWANGTTRMNKRVFTSTYGLSVPDLRNIYHSVRYDATVRGLAASDPTTRHHTKQIATDGTMFNKTTFKGTTNITLSADGVATCKELKKQTQIRITKEDAKSSKSCEKTWMYEENAEDLHETYTKILHSLPSKQMEFAVKAVANGLITRRWLSFVSNTDGKCPLCKHHDHTIGHILTGCKTSLHQGRYTYRHDNVLRVIRGWLKKSLEESNTKHTIWTDLMGENQDSSLPKGILPKHLNGMRPDIIISTTTTEKGVDTTAVWIIELTCPTEQRFTASNDLKRRKYEPVAAVFRKQQNINVVELVPIEVGARGRPARSLRNLKPLLQKNYSNAIEEAGRAAIIASMQIFYGSEDPQWRHHT